MLSNRHEPKVEENTPYIKENTTPLHKTEAKAPIAVIGPKIRFKGELEGEEDLLIQGSIDGTISLSGQNLIIGEQGQLRANARAKTINVEGRVKGDLEGEERISIRASSQVQGNIKAERVVLEDGAKFRGSIEMNIDDEFGSDLPKKSPLIRDKVTQKTDIPV